MKGTWWLTITGWTISGLVGYITYRAFGNTSWHIGMLLIWRVTLSIHLRLQSYQYALNEIYWRVMTHERIQTKTQ
jgi:hypothetical protein